MSNNKELKIPDYKQTESLQESKNYLKLLKQDVVDKLPDNKKKRYLDKISAIEKNTKQVDFHRDIPLLYDELEREIEKEKTAEKEKTQKELKDLENQNDQKEITRWQNILKNNPEVVGILSDELADHDSVLRDKIFHMITDLEKNPPVLDFYNSLPEEERKPLQEYIGKASSKTSKIIEYLIANPEKMKIFRKAFKTPTVTPVNSPTVTPVNNPTVTPVNNPAAIKVDNPTATPVNKLNGSRNTGPVGNFNQSAPVTGSGSSVTGSGSSVTGSGSSVTGSEHRNVVVYHAAINYTDLNDKKRLLDTTNDSARTLRRNIENLLDDEQSRKEIRRNTVDTNWSATNGISGLVLAIQKKFVHNQDKDFIKKYAIIDTSKSSKNSYKIYLDEQGVELTMKDGDKVTDDNKEKFIKEGGFIQGDIIGLKDIDREFVKTLEWRDPANKAYSYEGNISKAVKILNRANWSDLMTVANTVNETDAGYKQAIVQIQNISVLTGQNKDDKIDKDRRKGYKGDKDNEWNNDQNYLLKTKKNSEFSESLSDNNKKTLQQPGLQTLLFFLSDTNADGKVSAAGVDKRHGGSKDAKKINQVGRGDQGGIFGPQLHTELERAILVAETENPGKGVNIVMQNILLHIDANTTVLHPELQHQIKKYTSPAGLDMCTAENIAKLNIHPQMKVFFCQAIEAINGGNEKLAPDLIDTLTGSENKRLSETIDDKGEIKESYDKISKSVDIFLADPKNAEMIKRLGLVKAREMVLTNIMLWVDGMVFTHTDHNRSPGEQKVPNALQDGGVSKMWKINKMKNVIMKNVAQSLIGGALSGSFFPGTGGKEPYLNLSFGMGHQWKTGMGNDVNPENWKLGVNGNIGPTVSLESGDIVQLGIGLGVEALKQLNYEQVIGGSLEDVRSAKYLGGRANAFAGIGARGVLDVSGKVVYQRDFLVGLEQMERTYNNAMDYIFDFKQISFDPSKDDIKTLQDRLIARAGKLSTTDEFKKFWDTNQKILTDDIKGICEYMSTKFGNNCENLKGNSVEKSKAIKEFSSAMAGAKVNQWSHHAQSALHGDLKVTEISLGYSLSRFVSAGFKLSTFVNTYIVADKKYLFNDYKIDKGLGFDSYEKTDDMNKKAQWLEARLYGTGVKVAYDIAHGCLTLTSTDKPILDLINLYYKPGSEQGFVVNNKTLRIGDVGEIGASTNSINKGIEATLVLGGIAREGKTRCEKDSTNSSDAYPNFLGVEKKDIVEYQPWTKDRIEKEILANMSDPMKSDLQGHIIDVGGKAVLAFNDATEINTVDSSLATGVRLADGRMTYEFPESGIVSFFKYTDKKTGKSCFDLRYANNTIPHRLEFKAENATGELKKWEQGDFDAMLGDVTKQLDKPLAKEFTDNFPIKVENGVIKKEYVVKGINIEMTLDGKPFSTGVIDDGSNNLAFEYKKTVDGKYVLNVKKEKPKFDLMPRTIQGYALIESTETSLALKSFSRQDIIDKIQKPDLASSSSPEKIALWNEGLKFFDNNGKLVIPSGLSVDKASSDALIGKGSFDHGKLIIKREKNIYYLEYDDQIKDAFEISLINKVDGGTIIEKRNIDATDIVNLDLFDIPQDLEATKNLLDNIRKNTSLEIQNLPYAHWVDFQSFMQTCVDGSSLDIQSQSLKNLLSKNNKFKDIIDKIVSGTNKEKLFIINTFKSLFAKSDTTSAKSVENMSELPALRDKRYNELVKEMYPVGSEILLGMDKTKLQSIVSGVLDVDGNWTHAGWENKKAQLGKILLNLSDGFEKKKVSGKSFEAYKSLFKMLMSNTDLLKRRNGGLTSDGNIAERSSGTPYLAIMEKYPAMKGIFDSHRSALMGSKIGKENGWATDRENSDNMFGMTAFYRTQARGMSMTQPGETSIASGSMEKLSDNEQITASEFFNGQIKTGNEYLSQLDFILESYNKILKIKGLNDTVLTKDDIISLLQNRLFEKEVTVGGVKKKINLDISYQFYLMGECFNESVGPKLENITVSSWGGYNDLDNNDIDAGGRNSQGGDINTPKSDRYDGTGVRQGIDGKNSKSDGSADQDSKIVPSYINHDLKMSAANMSVGAEIRTGQRDIGFMKNTQVRFPEKLIVTPPPVETPDVVPGTSNDTDTGTGNGGSVDVGGNSGNSTTGAGTGNGGDSVVDSGGTR